MTMLTKKKTWLYTLGGVAGMVALLGWAFAPRPLEVESAVVTRGHFEASIDEDAKTRLHERYVVSAPIAGLLARITLREGDAVEAGATVATLTPEQPGQQADVRVRRSFIAEKARHGPVRPLRDTQIDHSVISITDHGTGETHTTRNPSPKLRKSGSPRPRHALRA